MPTRSGPRSSTVCVACRKQHSLPGRHHLRADQDRPQPLVPGRLPGDVQQGRDRRHRAAAAAGPGQLRDRLVLAAQDPQGDGPPGSSAPGRARRGRRDLRRSRRDPASAAGAPPARPSSAGRSRPAAARPARAASPDSPWLLLPDALRARPRGLPRRRRRQAERPSPPRRAPRGLLGLPSQGLRRVSVAARAPPGATPRSGCPASASSSASPTLAPRRPPRRGRPDAAPSLPRPVRLPRQPRAPPPSSAHGFARLIEQALRTRPTTYREVIATPGLERSE